MDNKTEQYLNSMEILTKISELIINESDSTTIKSIYNKAFNEFDDVKLFKLRYFLLKELEEVYRKTNQSENISKIFQEVYEVISYPHLNNNISLIRQKFTIGHITTLELAFNVKQLKQDFEAMEEISTLNDELKDIIETEDITDVQKAILKQICYEIDEAIEEHVITGNTAVQKLYESLVGKLVLYQEELKNINSDKVKETLSKVYKKVEGLHKVMNTLFSIGSKAKDIIDLLPF
ncbi:MAG: hypothetical protein GXO60_07920 [Epsilonproteobacteria bacterium]|nr:hypothetical protein [Campylobacterota bacterium]